MEVPRLEYLELHLHPAQRCYTYIAQTRTLRQALKLPRVGAILPPACLMRRRSSSAP